MIEASKPPALLVEALISHARVTPGKAFVHFRTGGDDSTLTYGSLLRIAESYARLYRSLGLEPGAVVLISARTSAPLFAAFFGALLVGCVPSMMPFPSSRQDPKLFWSSHNELFAHLGGGVVVTYPENVAAIEQNIQPGLMQVVSLEEADRHRDGPAIAPRSNDLASRRATLACLQHSSGTTGLKKGIPLTFGEIADQVESYAGVIGLTADDIIASWLPLYHDMGFVACFLIPASLGATVVMLDPFEWIMAPVSLFQAVAAHAATFVWLPNFAFSHLVNAIADDRHRVELGGVRAFINCSEPCKAMTFERFAARFQSWGVRQEQLQVCYAMAETVFAVTQTPIGTAPTTLLYEDPDCEPGSAPEVLLSTGFPVPGIKLQIVGPDRLPVSPGQSGEIAVQGPFVFQGYHKRRRNDPEIFHEGWFLTGDIGLVQDGAVYILGRKKDIIIVCGKNVFAHNIEALIGNIPGLRPGRTVALGVFNAELGSEDMVIIAEADPALADERSIRREIRQILENTVGLVPKKIVIVEPGWIVKSTSGKISRKENLSKYLGSRAEVRQHV